MSYTKFCVILNHLLRYHRGISKKTKRNKTRRHQYTNKCIIMKYKILIFYSKIRRYLYDTCSNKQTNNTMFSSVNLKLIVWYNGIYV